MEENAIARFKGSNVQHWLVVGTKQTHCGKDATLANRYPVLTRANSTERPYKFCLACTIVKES